MKLKNFKKIGQKPKKEKGEIMRKKIKLVMTIASLCLAFAIMAFGVYAATSATFTITSKVTYVCNDVFVNVTVKTLRDNNNDGDIADSGDIVATTYGVSYTGSGDARVPAATLKNANSSFVADNPEAAFAQVDQTETYSATMRVIGMEITIANVNANKACKFKVSALPTSITNTTVTLTQSVNSAAASAVTADTFVTIPANQSVVILYTRSLDDTSKTIGTTGTNEISWGSAETPITITIEDGAVVQP